MKDSIQEQLLQARRNQILDAASKVFAIKGFHPTTVKDIAQEAGIADGTIYNYFPSKTALLIGVFDRMRALIKPDDDAIVQLMQTDFRTFLKSFLHLPLNTLNESDFALLRVIISEMMVNEDVRTLYYEQIFEPTIALAETYLTQWAEHQQLTTLDIALTVRCMSSLVMGLMIQNIIGDDVLRSHWDDLPEFLTNFLINGLGHNLP